jgi:hypothetical protein
LRSALVADATSMIPRGTRSRPILHVTSNGKEGIPVFTNNINSPGFFHVTTFVLQQEAFRANAVTCTMSHPRKLVKNYCNCGFNISSAYVSFWSEGHEIAPLLSVEVYMPSHWSPSHFLVELENSILECSIISLINTFTLNGIIYPFISINSIHYRYLTSLK